jgi:hypothetical protein
LVIGNNQVFLMIYETHSNYFEVVAKLWLNIIIFLKTKVFNL